MTLKEFKQIMASGVLLLMGLIGIILIGLTVSTLWPLLFKVVMVLGVLGAVAFALGSVFEIFRGGWS